MTLTDIQSLLDGKCPGDSFSGEGVGMFAADLGTAYQQLGAKAVKAMVLRAEIFAQNVCKGAAE